MAEMFRGIYVPTGRAGKNADRAPLKVDEKDILNEAHVAGEPDIVGEVETRILKGDPTPLDTFLKPPSNAKRKVRGPQPEEELPTDIAA